MKAMETNYSAHQTLQFRVLTEQQIDKIYRASLECLQRTGVNVLNVEARALLAQAGAQVDNERVRIPAHIIQDALQSTPRSFTIWGRDAQYRLHMVPDRVYFGPGLTATNFVDLDTGERRLARRGDPALTARVCDGLTHMDYVMGLGLIGDVRPDLAPVYEFAELVANTGKPILGWGFSVANVRDMHAIALAAAGSEPALRSRPFFGLFVTSQPPLIHNDADLAMAFWAEEHGIPVIYVGGGSAGASAPVTGAGVLVTNLAASLSGLAILQLKKRGAQVCLGSVPEPMDMRRAQPTYGAPEMSLYSAALADISRWLGLPFMGTAGVSEAKTLDLQAAIESTIQVMLSGLSSATLVHDIGFLECGSVGSLEMVVMVDEIIGMQRRLMRGIEVTDETMQLDLIDRVGPGGEFISTRETAQQHRTELWSPTLMDRDPYVTWQAHGAETMTDRIRSKLRKILAAHVAMPLPAGAAEKIDEILRAAEARG
jgi:trimethylamine---corrinoid protein Co-methyltransferase